MSGRLAVLVAVLLATSGCQGGDRDPPAPAPRPAPAPVTAGTAPSAPAGAAVPDQIADPYTRDVDRICRVEELAGATAEPGVNPMLLTAQWLAANLETEAAREFLIKKLNTAADADRGLVLDAEATRVGLASCPTARLYDVPPPG